jgi:hypothetical protein
MTNADRSARVLLKSPGAHDRVFVRRTRSETVDWFDRLALSGGDAAFLQVYLDSKVGWHIVKSRGSA